MAFRVLFLLAVLFSAAQLSAQQSDLPRFYLDLQLDLNATQTTDGKQELYPTTRRLSFGGSFGVIVGYRFTDRVSVHSGLMVSHVQFERNHVLVAHSICRQRNDLIGYCSQIGFVNQSQFVSTFLEVPLGLKIALLGEPGSSLYVRPELRLQFATDSRLIGQSAFFEEDLIQTLTSFIPYDTPDAILGYRLAVGKELNFAPFKSFSVEAFAQGSANPVISQTLDISQGGDPQVLTNEHRGWWFGLSLGYRLAR